MKPTAKIPPQVLAAEFARLRGAAPDPLAALTARLRGVAERCETIATASRAQNDMLTAQAYEDAAAWIAQALEAAP